MSFSKLLYAKIIVISCNSETEYMVSKLSSEEKQMPEVGIDLNWGHLYTRIMVYP